MTPTTEELKALLEKATPGPWLNAAIHCDDLWIDTPSGGAAPITGRGFADAEQDAVFALIALAPTLAARVVALEELVKIAHEALDNLSKLGNGDRDGNSDGNLIAQAARAKLEERG